MASLILRSRVLSPSYLKTCSAAISTTAAKFVDDVSTLAKLKDTPLIRKEVALLTPEELSHKRKLEGTITVPGRSDISPISGIPEEHVKNRRVRIFMPSKNSMQSGTDNVGHWQMEFETRERWENPLMGWCSSGDPLSNMEVNFTSKDEAIEHCEKNGWNWYVHEEPPKKEMRPKSYGVNYSWNKRTRVSTK